MRSYTIFDRPTGDCELDLPAEVLGMARAKTSTSLHSRVDEAQLR